jgi:hypothetical protein
MGNKGVMFNSKWIKSRFKRVVSGISAYPCRKSGQALGEFICSIRQHCWVSLSSAMALGTLRGMRYSPGIKQQLEREGVWLGHHTRNIYCQRRCYGLSIKCSSLAHVWKPWSPAGGAILKGAGKFRRWELTGGSRSLGHIIGGYILPRPLPITLLCFLASMRWAASVTHSHRHAVLPPLRPKAMTPADLRLKPLKLWAKVKLPSF